MDEDKITMSDEMHQEEARKIWPGIRRTIDKAVDAGMPVKIKAVRDTAVRPKEQAEDGRAHVVQHSFIKYIIVVDTGQENVSE